MSRIRYTHNKTAAIRSYDGTPQRTHYTGGTPRRTDITPSLRGSFSARKQILYPSFQKHSHHTKADRFHAIKTHEVAKVARAGDGTGIITTTKTSKVAGPK
jgi:hypothetical protein